MYRFTPCALAHTLRLVPKINRTNTKHYTPLPAGEVYSSNNPQGWTSLIDHSGSNSSQEGLRCPVCSHAEVRPAKLECHLKERHKSIRKIVFQYQCGLHSTNSHSVGTHKKYCEGIQLEPKLHSCGHCVMSFDSENGFKVHVATVHPEVANVLLPTKRKNFKRTDQKLRFLAEKCRELKLKRTKNVKNALMELLPDRSEGAIASARKQTRFKAIERVLILELEQGGSSQGRRGMTTRTVEGEVYDENLEGLGERSTTNNAEEETSNSRWYRADAKEATLNYLNSPEVTGDIPNIIRSYLQKDVSWVEFVEKIAPYTTPPSGDANPPKCWNSQSRPNRKPNKNTRKRRKYRIVQRAREKNASTTMRKVVDGTFSFDEVSSTLSAVQKVEKVYRGRLERTFEYRKGTIGQKEVRHSKVYGAFSSEEVSKALGGISKDSTPGVDGWNISAIKKLSAENISALFNYWWHMEFQRRYKCAEPSFFQRVGNGVMSTTGDQLR